ncbi:hypothetical protein [Helicobacter pullorum]|uniref:hypothetical protein n=1 Tax=Helicobacter pullorum TaxID=35818 RepID=UPI001D2960BB|nr:hypothetical protein [Helicobacter pullorum]HJF84016.1 hypothetical protein [Helicobacter pullorum]
MNKLALVLGGVALGACGYGLKKWYDKTSEELYYTDDPKDILSEMASDAANKVYDGLEWLEKKILGEEALVISDLYGGKEAIENNPELKEQYEEHIRAIKSIFEQVASQANNQETSQATCQENKDA